MRIFILTGLAVAMLWPTSHAVARDQNEAAQASVHDFSAQSRRRPRARIVVTPPRPAAWTYPRPGYYSYPGPTGVRECVDWYATEYRAGGPVVTSQMACRWVVR